MAAWVRLASGELPDFKRFPRSNLLTVAYVVFALVSTWVALNGLVMGNLPLTGVLFVYAVCGVPEILARNAKATVDCAEKCQKTDETWA